MVALPYRFPLSLAMPNHSPRSRTRLLSAFQSLLSQHDYCDISLNQILSQAQVSKTSYYRYFDRKLDLFLALHQQLIEALLSDLTSAEQWLAEGPNPAILQLSQRIISKPAARRSLSHKLGNDWPLAQRHIKRMLTEQVDRQLQLAFAVAHPIDHLSSTLAAILLDYLGQLNQQLNGQSVEQKAGQLQWLIRALLLAAINDELLQRRT